MAFNNPELFWLLALIPLFIITGLLLGILSKKDKERFASSELYNNLTRSISKIKRRIKWLFFYAGLFFVIVALTDPRFGVKTEIVKHRGVDIVVLLDTSYSMLAEDIKPSRLEQAKYEISRLIDNLKGDRIALIVFTGKSLIQAPLTADYSVVKLILGNISTGMVPETGTNIEEAIESAIKLIVKGAEKGRESQMIVLFTDGESLIGNAESAARKAAGNGIKIFTVGIGTASGEIIPIRNERGDIEDYRKDSKGNVVKTALNEKALMDIAELTGGQYLRTKAGEADIQEIINQLGQLEKKDISERKISRLKERYQIPLGISIILLLGWLVINDRKRNGF